MTIDEWAGIAADLAAAYPTFPISGETATIYYETLKHFDADDVRQSAENWIEQHARMPTIAHLREGAISARKYRPALPPPDNPVDRETGFRYLAAAREALKQ